MKREHLHQLIKRAFANDKMLTTLDLSKQPGQITYLDCDYIEAIADALKSNTHVKTLDLSGYPLDDIEFNYLVRALYHNTSITRINLANTQITHEGISDLAKLMFSSTSITQLNLEGTPAIKSKQSKQYFGVIQQALINNRERANEKKTKLAA